MLQIVYLSSFFLNSSVIIEGFSSVVMGACHRDAGWQQVLGPSEPFVELLLVFIGCL